MHPRVLSLLIRTFVSIFAVFLLLVETTQLTCTIWYIFLFIFIFYLLLFLSYFSLSSIALMGGWMN